MWTHANSPAYRRLTVTERELADQLDPVERGRRLRAYHARKAAICLDGTTALPLGDTFPSTRLVELEEP